MRGHTQAGSVTNSDTDAANSVTLDLLKELLSAPCPSGREEALAAVVRHRLDAMGLESETDASGNVLVRLEGRNPDAPLLMLAAHIDEIGLVVTGVNADGSLRVDRSGQLKPHKLGEGPVEVIGDHDDVVPAVVSFGVGHPGGVGEGGALSWNDARLITGLSPEELARRGVRVGSSVVPPAWRRGPMLLGRTDDPLLGAWTLDDRGGVASLLLLLERIQRGDVQLAQPMIAAFTIHEEGGCHGSKNLCARERPTVLVAVDGAPVFPGSDLDLDGLCVWSKDAKGHCDQRLVRAVLEAGKQCGHRVQAAVMSGAWSDATAVYDAGFAPRVVTFGHVRENSHGFEVARLGSFNEVADVLAALITEIL